MSSELSTQYGGLFLHSPVVVGACPLMMDESKRIAFESVGAGAMVLPSIFEEQVIQWAEPTGRAMSVREKSLLDRSQRVRVKTVCCDAIGYLALVNRASTQVSIPVIASMNGHSGSGWLDYAGELQEAGAAAIELNVHSGPIREYQGSRDIEDSIVNVIAEIKRAISIPLFVKLERGYFSIPHLARRICSGVEGIVLYGRQPDTDICLDSLKLNSTWSLTSPGTAVQLLGPILQTHEYCPALSIAASGGISSAEDVIKVLLAGADVAMVTSLLYRKGPDSIRLLNEGLSEFLKKHQLPSLRDLQFHRPIEFDSDEERTSYIAALSARLGDHSVPSVAGATAAGNIK